MFIIFTFRNFLYALQNCVMHLKKISIFFCHHNFMTVELVKLLFWYLFKPRKVGWLDEGRRGLHKGGGNRKVKYLKMGWNRKEGRGNKTFKKRGKPGQGVSVLKRGGGTPLLTMSSGQNWQYNNLKCQAFSKFIAYEMSISMLWIKLSLEDLCRAYTSSLLQAIITHNHLLFLKGF